jgi:hypothetical protein
MLELKTVLLIFGILFLMVVLTRRAIRKQKTPSLSQVKSAQGPASAIKPRMTEEQFNKSWNSLSYLMLLAAAGNLFMLYNSVKGALETQSYILWIDTVFSLAAAVIAVIIWRLHPRNLVIAYLIITIIPIMIFISTGHSTDGIIRLFPLMLVYFVVKPVWEYLD